MINQQSRQKIYAQFMPRPDRVSAGKVVHAMAGIPAAGKSTFVTQQIEQGAFPRDAFVLNPDLVMQSLPEYKHDVLSEGAEAAFSKWELPARDLAYEMFEHAREQDFPIIKDMGCARVENYKMLEQLKRDGYHIHFYHIFCDPKIALERTKSRIRHTPPAMIYERDTAIHELFPRYAHLFDQFFSYDNSDLDQPFMPISQKAA